MCVGEGGGEGVNRKVAKGISQYSNKNGILSNNGGEGGVWFIGLSSSIMRILLLNYTK